MFCQPGLGSSFPLYSSLIQYPYLSLSNLCPARVPHLSRHPNVILMLGHRLQHWSNIKTTLGQSLVSAGMYVFTCWPIEGQAQSIT